MRWQDEVSEEEWGQWFRTANRISRSRRISPTLGADDFAATAIEKLWTQNIRPKNIEGWLSLTITRQYIDRFRQLVRRGGRDVRIFEDADWDREMIAHAIGSPIDLLEIHESVAEVLDVLEDREKEILLLSAAGVENQVIAQDLGYASGRVVATRLGQIKKKVQEAIGQSGSAS